jgi:2-polyprenyl-6-methoxyphenol hydroxylase-like FAD-dependent oxidoreductase
VPYDVIVVGARVTGAATAMLLARAGLRVLAVDRAQLPGDTLSTHQVQLPAIAALQRWGLLGAITAAGTPATSRLRFDSGPVPLDGRYPVIAGADALYSPRRMLLDQVLLDAARQAGAEVRLGCTADGLVWDEGRVTGISGRARRGQRVTERARLVVGADGRRSSVARWTGAASYRTQPPRTMASYTYWDGVPTTGGGGEIYRRAGRAVAAFPTNDGLTMIYVAARAAELGRARADLVGHYLAGLDGCGDLPERVRAARQAERLRTSPGCAARMRVPRGPGWALAGDAGLVLDPVSAHGISRALGDAQLLADAITGGLDGRGGLAGREGLGGRDGLAAALAGYHRARDRAALPVYRLTAGIALLNPPGAAERRLYASLAGRPDEVSRFFGVLAGTETLGHYRRSVSVLRTVAGGGRRLAA